MGAVFDEITGMVDGKATRPVWMMRQAGRYLPEYRAVRAKFPSFIEFCYTPDAATQVTLQPIDRFGFDAAIIFSDILVIPQALGQKVWFVTGEGPKLGSLPSVGEMRQRLEDGSFLAALAPVYQALRQTRSALSDHVDLFGFAGAPWTLLTYMIEGASSNTYSKALAFADEKPAEFSALLGLVQECVSLHLDEQVKAGANLVQVFDSWAGGIPGLDRQREWSFRPLVDIASGISDKAPAVVFSKGLSQSFAAHCRDLGPDLGRDLGHVAFAVGQDQVLGQVRDLLPNGAVTQGNLDPLLMPGEWSPLRDATLSLIRSLSPGDLHVMNLGHGITPQGNADNVARWVDLIRETPR